MIPSFTRDHTSFMGAADNRLDADVFGDNGPPVLLLHGGGQTRYAWRSTAEKLASKGYTAYTLDQRGHGNSEWVANGAYEFRDFSADLKLVATEITCRSGVKPIVVGASLGGIAALLAEGEPKRASDTHMFSALVLVDITPRVDMTGVNKILGFMRAHAKEGFATIADAAHIVAQYLPHRPRPKSNEGLKKNLRRQLETALQEATRRIEIPVLLVRGAYSELVKESHVQEFLELVPHAEYVNVGDARHMVAGDRNDQFSAVVLSFIERLSAAKRCST